jgi:hypothetical protein
LVNAILITIIITSISGCLDTDDDNELSYYFWFIDANDGYILFPDIVDSNNESVIDLSLFRVTTGSCNISKEMVNNSNYINISCETNEVRIFIQRRHVQGEIDEIRYDGHEVDWENYNEITMIFYSGSNNVETASNLQLKRGQYFRSLVVEVIFINRGWNRVEIQEF